MTADAYANQKFWGRVVRVGEQLGPKNVRTDEPTERVDWKIQTLVELDRGAEPPVDLRVDADIVGDQGRSDKGWTAGTISRQTAYRFRRDARSNCC